MPSAAVPRLRQVALAARDLDAVAGQLRTALGLGAPFSDPAVGYFGLRNAVFALGDTFLEVVSPVQDGTAAGRLIERRGGDCGYMVMLQVDDLAAARTRAADIGVREVFEVTLDDIAEVHLHPADMRGAIVSLSVPVPPTAWRWAGPDWQERSVVGGVRGATVTVRDGATVQARWEQIAGGEVPGLRFDTDGNERGIVEVVVDLPAGAGRLGSAGGLVEIAGVRFRSASPAPLR